MVKLLKYGYFVYLFKIFFLFIFIKDFFDLDSESFNPNRKPRDMPPSEPSSSEYEDDEEFTTKLSNKSDVNNNASSSEQAVTEIADELETTTLKNF